MKDDDDLVVAGHPVRFQLQWFDQAQFTGFYVAADRRFYDAQGLKVEIIPGGYAINPIQSLLDGRADIALATGDQVLINRAKGSPIRAVGTVFDGSVACFMSRADAHIDSPASLVGKKVGVYRGFDTENVLLGLLKRHGVSPSAVNIMDAGNPEAFITGDLDVFPSYTFNEPLQMEARGIKVSLLTPDAFGIRAYSDTVITTEAFLRDNREIVQRFLAASSKGWDEARHNPESAIEALFAISRNMTRDAGTYAHQRAMLAEALTHLRHEVGGVHSVFKMDPSRWSDMEEWLVEIQKVNKRGNVAGLCDYELAEGL